MVDHLVYWSRRMARFEGKRLWTACLAFDVTVAALLAFFVAWWVALVVAVVMVPSWIGCLGYERWRTPAPPPDLIDRKALP